MQAVVNRKRVVNESEGVIGGFSIANSAKMFNILSKQIYSNAVLAVVRELSTNAWDAHKMVGKESVPFDVHLPSGTNPVFYIRDYGPGLSEENVMGMYTTYGMSTKENSNDAIGCFGLGSKSPFAYVDQFTVESFYDGKKSTYTAFKDSEGYPRITPLCSEPTSEPSGLKVSIGVNAKDYSKFGIEASNIYSNFDVVPNFVNVDAIINKPTYTIRKPTYGIRQGSNPRVIMGQVAYPISYTVPNLTAEQAIVLRSAVDIFCNIGDVSLTVSRESLEYDSKTISTIMAAVNTIIKDAKDDIAAKVNSYSELYEARLNCHNIRESYHGIADIVKRADMTYKGEKLYPNGNLYLPISGNAFTLREVELKRSSVMSSVFIPENYIYVYVNDKIGLSRIRYAKIMKPGNYVAVEGDLAAFKKFLGTSKDITINSDTLAKKPAIKRSTEINTYVFVPGMYYESDRWRKEVVKLSDYKYYVLESKGSVYYTVNGNDYEIRGKTLDRLIESFNLSKKIVKIAPKYESKVIDGGLVSISTDIEKYITTEVAKLPMWKDELARLYVGYNSELLQIINMIIKNYSWTEGEKYVKLIPPESSNVTKAKKIHELYQVYEPWNKHASLNFHKITDELSKIETAISKKYPLLFGLDNWGSQKIHPDYIKKNLNHCVEYVKLVEKGAF